MMNESNELKCEQLTIDDQYLSSLEFSGYFDRLVTDSANIWELHLLRLLINYWAVVLQSKSIEKEDAVALFMSHKSILNNLFLIWRSRKIVANNR